MSGADEKPVVNIPSLDELEKMVFESLQKEPSPTPPSGPESYSWEDFIDN